MADIAKGKAYPVHNSVSKFGTVDLENIDEQMVIPANLESFAPSIDGTIEKWYSMDVAGWAKATMTGKKLEFSFKGKWSVGDSGDDYIASLAWKFGQDVMTKLERTMVSGAKLVYNVVVNMTTPGGNDTTSVDGLEFEMADYGKPTSTPV